MKLVQRWKQTALHNKALVLTGVLVAFGTLFYAAAAAFQVWILEKNSEQSSAQTERLIETANKLADNIDRQTQSAVAEFHRLADAANNSLQTTQNSFRDDQRAWIGVGEVAISQYYPNPLKVDVTFVNSGKTPALRIESANQMFSAPKRVPQAPPEIEKQLIFRRAGAIPPQGKRTLTVTESDLTFNLVGQSFHDWLASNHGLLEAKSSFLYADGEIQYDDVYGRRHRTTWCVWMYDPNTHSLGMCEQGNDMN